MTGETRDPRDGSQRDEPQTNDGPPAVRDALASHYDDYDVVGRLHDVPPHAVYEVVAGGTRGLQTRDGSPRRPGRRGAGRPARARETPVPVPRVLAVGDDHFVPAWHDGLPEHVGVADGAVAGVVDFEHALVGPAEWDFWRTAMPTFEGPFRPGAAGPTGPLHRAFRAGYESVRPLPSGFDRRAPVYWTLGGVSYLTALFLQDRHDPAGTRRRAAALRKFVVDGLDWLADRRD